MGQIDLNGLTSGYSDYMSATVQNATAEKLKSVAGADYSKATDDELMKVCKEFESYFLEQVFKEMNKTVPKSDYSSQSTSNLVDYFKENTIKELASQSTEQNRLGLAQMLYEQMKRNVEM